MYLAKKYLQGCGEHFENIHTTMYKIPKRSVGGCSVEMDFKIVWFATNLDISMDVHLYSHKL